jgi:putative transposase
MANNFIQLYTHFVFAVKHRKAQIKKEHKERIHQYITGVVEKDKHKMLAVHCMPDHTHLFLGIHPTKSVSDIMEAVKSISSKFINDQNLTNTKFEWQRGYGAFSISRSRIDSVCQYIFNQEEHHRKKSFKEEFLQMLKEHEMEYDEQYLFDFFEDTDE